MGKVALGIDGPAHVLQLMRNSRGLHRYHVPETFDAETWRPVRQFDARVICAWCQIEIQPGDDHDPPSHGICGACATQFCKEAGLDLD